MSDELNKVPENLITGIAEVSTNPIVLLPGYKVISSKQFEEIEKSVEFWKKQENNVKIQEALLEQMKFFYAVRRTILFVFPICLLVIFSIILYILNNENIMDITLFRGLTIFVGLAAIFEIVYFPVKEKTLESQINGLSLEIQNHGKKIDSLLQQMETLEGKCSSQEMEMKKTNEMLLRQKGTAGKTKNVLPRKRK